MEMEIEKHEGTILLEIDVSNDMLKSIQTFYNVTSIPYLILMRNYDILYEGNPASQQVHEILAIEHNKHKQISSEVVMEKPRVNTETKVETKLEGGIKKIITTNTNTYTEPELLVEIQPEEYDIIEYFHEGTNEPESVAITTHRIKQAVPQLKDVKDENINIERVDKGGLKQFLEELNRDQARFTHIVAVKKRVPVKYTPSYKTKVLKTITTEEMTDEKRVDAGDYTGKSVYYTSLAEAEDDVKRLELIEEAKVKEMTEEEINRLYAGGTIQKQYEPIKTTYKQSIEQPQVRKIVYKDEATAPPVFQDKIYKAVPEPPRPEPIKQKIEFPEPEKRSWWKPKTDSLTEETVTTTTTKHIVKDNKGHVIKEEISEPVVHQTKEKKDVNLVQSILAPEELIISKSDLDDSKWKADQTEGAEGKK